MVQGPSFSRHLTHAAHQDGRKRIATAERPDPMPSYVVSCYHSSSPISARPLAPTGSASVITAPENCLRREKAWQPDAEPEQEESKKQQGRNSILPEIHPNAKFQCRPSILRKSPSRASTRPLLGQQSLPQLEDSRTHIHIHTHTLSGSESLGRHSLTNSLRHASFFARRSPSALSLSGRPGTQFKTWTTITADPACRDSWPAGQKKSRQPTSIRWLLWLCLMLLVVGLVVAMAVLKTHDII